MNSDVLSRPLPHIRSHLRDWLRSTQQAYDNHAGLVFMLLAAYLSLRAWIGSQVKPLWFDELLGLSAATAPRVRDLVSALASSVDSNPPLYHLLTRFSINLFGYSAASARLPAFVCMLIFLLCVFVIVARRLAPSYGVLAVLLILSMPVMRYAWEARTYALVLCLTGLAVVAYQTRIERNSIVSLTLLSIYCGCLPFAHYYAVLIIGAFLAAELVRTLDRRQIDWQALAAILLPPALVLLLLRDLIRAQRAVFDHYHPGGSLVSFIFGYDLLSISGWVVYIGMVALALGIWLGTRAEDENAKPPGPGFSAPELALAATLLLLPFAGVIAAKFTHIYVGRYFMASSAGYVVLTCYLLASFHRRCAGAALLVSMALVAGLSVDLVIAIKQRHDPPAFADLGSSLGRLGLPVVFQDAKDYVVARELNPEMAGQLFYAAEPELARKVTGTEIDDRLMLALAKLQPVQVWKLDDMTRKTEHWLVVPASYGWLVPCLTRMGASMRLVQEPGWGALSAFQTEMPRPESMQAPWCEGHPQLVKASQK